ncbi:MAG: adenylate/guanylate cyclase domain-containing protein [Pseudomonadota bacterium]
MHRLLSAVFNSSQLVRLVGLVLLAAMIMLRLWDPAPLEVLRLKTFDTFQRIKPNDNPARPVVIVDIDEESLAAKGQWPWPRTLIAEMMDNMRQAGAVAVGLDIIFAEEDRTSPALILESAVGVDDQMRQQLLAMPSNDTVLAQAMGRGIVVVGQSGYHRALERQDSFDVPSPPLATLGGDPKPFLLHYPDLLHNIEELQTAANGGGALTSNSDADGITRRVPLAIVARDRIYATLSVELLRVAAGNRPLIIRTNDAGIEEINVAGLSIPTDESARAWVRFSESDPARYVSAAGVLDGEAQALARLNGKIVLVGTSALGLFDIKATPLDPVMPGVEVHAQLIENILTKQHLVRPNFAIAAELLAAFLVGLFIIVVVPFLPAIYTLLSGVVVNAGIIGGSYWLFADRSFLIDPTFPLLTSAVVFGALVFYSYIREESQRREIRSAFRQYLSPDVVEQLASDPSKLKLGGETKEMTILFSDVRGFTSISEEYKDYPEALTELINRLLTPLSEAVVRHGGTIDKYMGDNIMAFWNAPLDDEAHASRALSAALEMLATLETLNAQIVTETTPDGNPTQPFAIGVGLNTGVNVVGNMGSDLRFDYTVLGDNVNVASRLEGQTKSYGVGILVGERTAALASDQFILIEVDLVRVKGKAEPERVFTVLGKSEPNDGGGFDRLANAFAAMLEHYRNQDWDEAEKQLRVARKADGGGQISGLLNVYQGRIASFREAPPPKGWDGVFTAATK